jgi:hypothetical protein
VVAWNPRVASSFTALAIIRSDAPPGMAPPFPRPAAAFRRPVRVCSPSSFVHRHLYRNGCQLPRPTPYDGHHNIMTTVIEP